MSDLYIYWGGYITEIYWVSIYTGWHASLIRGRAKITDNDYHYPYVIPPYRTLNLY